MPQHVHLQLPPGTALAPSLDPRTNDEILTFLKSPPPPVTSPLNIWAFWDKGFDALRPWQKRNLIGWVRKLTPHGFTVRLLDLLPDSPASALNFIDDHDRWLPGALIQGRMSGQHKGQHASDFVRLPLLWLHGGIYLDVGVMLLGDLVAALWKPIADPGTEWRLGGFHHAHRKNSWGSMQNFCIASMPREELLERWQRVMLAAWGDAAGGRAGKADQAVFQGVPYELNPRVLVAIKPGTEQLLLDYFVNLLAWEKVKVTVDERSGWNGPEYVRNHVLLLEPLQEAFAAEARTTTVSYAKAVVGMLAPQWLTRWMGMGSVGDGTLEYYRLNSEHLFDLLSCPREAAGAPFNPALHAEAQSLTAFLLGQSTLIKLYHGHGYMRSRPLATFWDTPGNEDADVRPGSFGEYLRYAGEVIDQKRVVRPMRLARYTGPVVSGPMP